MGEECKHLHPCLSAQHCGQQSEYPPENAQPPSKGTLLAFLPSAPVIADVQRHFATCCLHFVHRSQPLLRLLTGASATSMAMAAQTPSSRLRCRITPLGELARLQSRCSTGLLSWLPGLVSRPGGYCTRLTRLVPIGSHAASPRGHHAITPRQNPKPR